MDRILASIAFELQVMLPELLEDKQITDLNLAGEQCDAST